MDDSAYKAMTIENNKHIDTMASSIVTLANNVGTTNRKLDDLVEVINTHNVLSEKVSNLHDNVNDFSKRIYSRIEAIEHKQNHSGCSRLQIANETVKSITHSVDIERDRTDKLETKVSQQLSITVAQWAYAGTVLAFITFCSWLMLSFGETSDKQQKDIYRIDGKLTTSIESNNIVKSHIESSITVIDNKQRELEGYLNRNYGHIQGLQRKGDN